MAISHSIHIKASVPRVWEITTDIDQLPEVTPTIEKIRRLDPGELAVGDKFKVWQPHLVAAVWTVTEVDHKRRVFAWSRRLGMSKLTATHRVKRHKKKGCLSELTLEVSGGLGPGLVERAMRKGSLASLQQENEAIKAAAEEK